jgi:hypothetical protein
MPQRLRKRAAFDLRRGLTGGLCNGNQMGRSRMPRQGPAVFCRCTVGRQQNKRPGASSTDRCGPSWSDLGRLLGWRCVTSGDRRLKCAGPNAHAARILVLETVRTSHCMGLWGVGMRIGCSRPSPLSRGQDLRPCRAQRQSCPVIQGLWHDTK